MPEQYIVLEQQPHGPVVERQHVHLRDTATQALDLAAELMRDADAGQWYVVYRLGLVR